MRVYWPTMKLQACLPLLACLPATVVLGQSVPESRPLPGLVVTATRVAQDGFDLPMAIDRIDADSIAEGKPQVNLSEALNRVPGIAVLNRQNYAQDLQLSLRGFGARSTFGVRGVRLIADGIPATMPDGQGQAASFSLSSADHIEVLRGPFSSLYGNSSGGVVQIFTVDGSSEPTLRGSFFGGSFGTQKIGLQFSGQQQELNYVVDESHFSTDGYRNHSAATRDQLNAKFKLPLAAGRLTIVVNALDQPDTQDPLGLTRVQLQSDPRQADNVTERFNTRKSIRQHQIGAVYDLGRAAESGGELQTRLYGGDRSVTQYLGQEGATPLSSGGVVDLDRAYGGVGLRWTRSVDIDGRRLTVTAGFDGDRMREHRSGFVNSAGQQGALKRDENDTVANADGYAQAEWQWAERWSVSGGARTSHVTFESRDHYIVGANPDDSGRVSYTRTTPVVGVVYRPTSDARIYANYGEGFETPTFAELAYRASGLGGPGGATGLNFALQPAKSRHAETGIKIKVGANTRINAALFRIVTRDEIVTNASSGGRSDFRNAAKTQRDGVEILTQSFLPLGFEVYLAYTRLNARFTSPYTSGTPPVTIPAGSRLPGVAKDVLFGELAWRSGGFHAALEYRASSKVYVNDINSDAAAGYGVVSVRAGSEQTIGRGPNAWRFTEFVRADNVGDRRYAGSVIVAEANGRFFEPAPRRNYLAGVTAQLSF